MKRRLLSLSLCFALLASILAVPGIVSMADTISWQDGAVGQYAVLDAAPTDTPVNNSAPQNGTTGTNMNRNQSSAGWAYLMDGSVSSGTVRYSTPTAKAWYQFTFVLGSTVSVDRLFVASADAATRQVSVKFYASTELATLYDDSNLIAAKDGLGENELNVLLKGTAKEAKYVGFATYYPDANTESGVYPGIGARASQTHLTELAVYAAAAEEGPAPTPDEDGFYAADTGKYKVVDAVPTDTPINTAAPQKGITGQNFGRNQSSSGYAYLTDGSLTSGTVMYCATGAGQWDQFTFVLDKEYNVDRLFLGSEEGGCHHVWVKFYASTELATLYDDSNLIAEKNGLTDDTLNVLLKGAAKKATYVGLATYYPNTATDKDTYPDIEGWSSNIRFNELAVYAVATTPAPGPGPKPEGPPADEYGYYNADTGKYKVLDFVPNETPLNTGCKPFIGTSTTNFNQQEGGKVGRLTDGSLEEKQSYFQSNTALTGYWEKITFDLGETKTVERLFVASEDAGTRHVAVKFYASTKLSNLYDNANLIAAKDGFGVDKLSFLLKGTAKQAKYVGLATYVPNMATDSTKYPGISGRSSQFRFRELAVYGVATGIEKDKDGFYAADTGKYKVVDSVPTDTPINTAAPQKGITGTDFSRNKQDGAEYAALTDSSVTSGTVMYYATGAGQWDQFTFKLDKEYNVDRLFLGSQEGGRHHVWVKFYASTKLATLYDDSNLIAEKNGLTDDTLNVLLKGAAKKATYVGLATYYPDTATDKDTYPDIEDWSSNIRFNELAVYGTLIPDPFTTTVITGDNYQTALPTGKNLLKGEDIENKTVDYLQMLKPTGVAWADVTTGEGVYNQPLLTDGKMNGINIPTTESNVGSLKNFAGTAFVYDLRGTVDISHLLIHAAKEDNHINYLVTTLDVYVSDKLDTLLTEEKLVETFTFTLEENVKLFTTDTQVGAIKGRYVAFKPKYCQNLVARFGELGVYGTYESGPRDFDRPIFEETVVTPENYTTTLPTEKNLLLGEGINNKPAAYLQMLKPDGAPWGVSQNDSNGLTNYANLIDGKLNGINIPTTEGNVGSLKNFDKGAFVYDLRGTVDISKLLIHADKESGASYLVGTVEVYVGNDLNTLLTDDNYIQTVSFTMAENVKVFTPKEEIKGRYIAFLPQYCQYSIARFSELGVYGTYEDGPRDFDLQIIQGKQPVDYYFAPMGKPDTRLNIIPMADRQEATPVDIETLTNGSWDDRTQFDLRTAIGEAGDGFEYGPGGTLKQGAPWVVLVYYLEGTVDVNTISVAGLTGSTAIAGVDFYVGKLQMELFNSENKVYTTNGEKTYWDAEAEDTYLDPAYDKSQQLHTVDLGNQGGVEGRYVGIVITRPYACDKQGWGFARLSEVEVGGTRIDYDPAFTDDMHIWTDAATGITANLSRLNNDDMAFFQNIGGMTVVKTAIPADLERNVDDNWLAVDGNYAYTIQLKDKSGKVISDEELGDRYWKITFPNKGGEFRMMGLLEGDTVTRLQHSYSSADDKHVIVGNDMKSEETMVVGNDLTFVYLRYNTLEYIEKQNSIGDTEFVPYITAGAASTAPVATAPWWLYGLVLLLLVGCVYTVVSTRRVRQ